MILMGAPMGQHPSGVTLDLSKVASKGIVLLIIGVMLIMVGFGMIAVGSFNDLFSGQPIFPGIYSLGLVVFGLGVALIVIGLIVKLKEKPLLLTTLPSSESSTSPQVVKETTVVKEVVMIPCRYCGALMPQTSTFCPNCGAKRTA
jgi:ribosomal protein L40E